MMKKQSISVILMVTAILAIIAFQGYWLKKTYKEEEAALKLRTGLIFRETLFQLQGGKLKLDTGEHIRIPGRGSINSMMNVLRIRARDTLRKRTERRLVFSSGRRSNDSGAILNQGDERMFNIMLEVDSLQDTLSVKEVDAGFKTALKKENIPVAFTVIRSAISPNERRVHEMETEHVVVGFRNPVSYGFVLLNEKAYLVKQIRTPLLFSFFLVGVTLISFVSLYRNLQAQKRLTILKNDFINNITHELKTPIATVSVAIEAMRNFNVLDDPQKSKEYLDISASELQRLSLLVDKVLKLSMFEKQEIELNKQHFDLKKLIDEVISSLRLQIEKLDADIHVLVSGSGFNLFADRLHITSVLYNLLDNALKYSRQRPVISVQLKKDRQQLVLTVTDNGLGIPAAYHNKIFEKFFRVPGGDKHNVKGYGLGLSYVAYVVNKHHGSIEVYSGEKEGSSFVVKLPSGNE